MRYEKNVFSHVLIWFGAAVSIAEIEAGTLLAGGSPGVVCSAVVAGHLLGGLMLYGCGIIGARMKCSAMASQRAHFGRWGAGGFAVANILQLIGWTAVMLAQGARATQTLFPCISFNTLCILLGLLVILWIYIGLSDVGRLNSCVMAILCVLLVVLTVRISCLHGSSENRWTGDGCGFWQSFEIAVAMPLSWLPLISDYSKEYPSPQVTTGWAAGVYTIVSCWMYGIGYIGARMAGTTEVPAIVALTGFSVAAMVVVVLSTVTTTFLDAFSAGESARSLLPSLKTRRIAVLTTMVGCLIAMAGILEHLTSFLYVISAIFAPMAAVQIADFLRRRDVIKIGGGCHLRLHNLFSWAVGFAVYQYGARCSCPIGATIPSIAFSFGLAWILNRPESVK